MCGNGMVGKEDLVVRSMGMANAGMEGSEGEGSYDGKGWKELGGAL